MLKFTNEGWGSSKSKAQVSWRRLGLKAYSFVVKMSGAGLRVSGGLGASVLGFGLFGFRALRLFTAVEGEGLALNCCTAILFPRI